ncbi:programmed cell death protein 4 [Atheta coriaria]|uniref:programmed cell death protein 4 n=1 Tax=Dalotia coriaria TaxID=877792 RepID=UPI0031F3C5E1
MAGVDRELEELSRGSGDEMLVDGKDEPGDADTPMNLAADSTLGNKRKLKKIARQNSKENVVANSAAGFIHAPRSWKNSRRSRNGFGRGLPKKGGAGGKGVWGLPGSELLEAYEDVNDPNYDNENMSNGDIELKAVIPDITVEDVRRKVEPIILEYFENGDTHEAAISLSDAVPHNLRDILVQFMVEIAMDHKASHREMTSVLVSDLYGQVVTEGDITKGFENLLANLGDLIIDIPDAPMVLGNFIARAIADDCIPPKFLAVMKDKSDAEPFQEALDRANTLFTMKHGIVRLHNVWGVGGALRPVKYLTRQMNLLLLEYISSRDISEATRCVRALEVPHFHHELVYESIVMALEANSASKEEALCTLLKSLSDAIIITPDQLEHGFFRVFEDLADISMDVPLAYIILDRFVDRCYKEGFLTEQIVKRLPSRGRKRFVSEGDQHLIKNHRII